MLFYGIIIFKFSFLFTKYTTFILFFQIFHIFFNEYYDL
jgi:hypothetical protein